jgi:hypothetical protein
MQCLLSAILFCVMPAKSVVTGLPNIRKLTSTIIKTLGRLLGWTDDSLKVQSLSGVGTCTLLVDGLAEYWPGTQED